MQELNHALEGNLILLIVSGLIALCPHIFFPWFVNYVNITSDMICNCTLVMDHVTGNAISESLSKKMTKCFFFLPSHFYLNRIRLVWGRENPKISMIRP